MAFFPRLLPFKDNSTSSQLRSEEHTSELQSHLNLVCRLLLEKKNRQQLSLRDEWTRPGTFVPPSNARPESRPARSHPVCLLSDTVTAVHRASLLRRAPRITASVV